MLAIMFIIDLLVLIALGLITYGFVKETVFDKYGRVTEKNWAKSITKGLIEFGKKIGRGTQK